ncbi:MAG TPA: hypothetical protein VK619_20010 [Pyrinomonadaceae bacterium]|nr:hypothetical protein [Pyrinomonadaceae bacterium]
MSDYLWDKSGEVDPEIEQLEELLGTLSHKPHAATLPDSLLSQVGARAFTHWSEWAAAAVLILMGLAGLWIGSERLDARAQIPSLATQEIAVAPVETGHISETAREVRREAHSHNRSNNEIASGRPFRRRPLFNLYSNQNSAQARSQTNVPQSANQDAVSQTPMSVEEIAEARRARDELILALQVASAKLNHAQHRAQSLTSTNPGLNP